MIFQNRTHAGKELAKALERFKESHPLILALPRGGVPVAAEVADHLGTRLDVLIVRKLGAPENPEYAIGALAEGGEPWLRSSALGVTGVEKDELRRIVECQREEVKRRVLRYRQGRPPADVAGQTVIIVDDGLATGATMMAAVLSVRSRGATKVIVAVPCAASSSAQRIRKQADEVVALIEREDFYAVGQWYRDFHQVEDEDVEMQLAKAASTHRDHPELRPVQISPDGLALHGDVTEPEDCRAWVIFAHGSGSSRKSPRNMKVARGLNAAGFGTLLFDLLTPQEEEFRRNTFDIALLSRRLLMATRWAKEHLSSHPICYFGASTGAAAALCAAADAESSVAAVISCGGRPDLAREFLKRVRCPVLLIVGSYDEEVLDLNREAANALPHAQLVEVPGASHLFEEPGKLDAVVRLAATWLPRQIQAKHEPAVA